MRRTGALAALGVLLAVALAACAGKPVERASPAAMSNRQVQAIEGLELYPRPEW